RWPGGPRLTVPLSAPPACPCELSREGEANLGENLGHTFLQVAEPFWGCLQARPILVLGELRDPISQYAESRPTSTLLDGIVEARARCGVTPARGGFRRAR